MLPRTGIFVTERGRAVLRIAGANSNQLVDMETRQVYRGGHMLIR